MNANAENREKTRFPHESKVTLESNEIGFQRDARMYNFSDFGIYFESDYRLQPETEVFVGISDSPFASEPDQYERYRGIIKWRKTLPPTIMAMALNCLKKHLSPPNRVNIPEPGNIPAKMPPSPLNTKLITKAMRALPKM